jgi:hypothetical protein
MHPTNIMIIIFILIITLVIIYLSKKRNTRDMIEHEIQKNSQALPQTRNVRFTENTIKPRSNDLVHKLGKLKHDVGQLVMKSAIGDRGKIMQMYHNTVNRYNEEKISQFVENLSPSLKKDVTLDGATIKEPVLKMYNRNFMLFEKLYAIGLIPLLGNIVAMTHWSQFAKNRTLSGFSYFVKCLNGIDWTSKDVWSSIDATTGHVARCTQ